MAIEVKFLTDVEDVVRGTKTIGDKLEAVADELDAMGRAGSDSGDLMARGMAEAHRAADKAGDGIGTAFRDGSRTAGKAIEGIGDDIKAAAKTTDTLERGLQQTAKAGTRAGDDIGDAFKDGAKQAGKSIEGIGDDIKTASKSADALGDKGAATFRQLGQDAKAAGDKVGKSQADGFKDAGDSLGEFKDEANSTAKETAASFDGSAESIVGSFQEIAANAFAGFGPAGAAAGLAAALGIGMAVTAMQAGAENATALKQKAVDMLDQLEEAGGDLSKVDYADTIKGWGREVMEDNWVSFWADESTTKFQETTKDAKAAAVDAVDAVKAAAGSADDSRAFLDKTGDAWQRLSEKIQEGTTYTADGTPVMDAAAQAAKGQQDALSDLRGQAEDNIKTTETATEIYGIETAAVDDGTAALEAKNKALEETARKLDEASGTAMSAVEAEINYNDVMEQGAKDIAANGKGLDLHTDAGKANQQTLVDMAKAANEMRDAQINQGASTADVTAKTAAARESFIKAAMAAGKGAEDAKALADRYGLVPENVDTYVKAHDVQKTKNELDGLGNPVKVPVQPYMDVGAKWRYQVEMAELTAQRQQTVLVKKLTEGVSIP